jgi:peptidoglycan/xylan/chitin deacetylase (PgdA/CDA1 family)
MFYFVKTPGVLRALYPSLIWKVDTEEKNIYLSFDDGPHPVATPFILDQLKTFNAKATFFCLGKNVVAEPDIYRRIIDEGHKVANHSHDHLNGWKTDDKKYVENIRLAAQHIDSNLFRPPYGRITKFQSRVVREQLKMKVIMWDVLSGDFDLELTPQQCLDHVILKTTAGSIVVFHDSEKAWPRLEFALPKMLEHFTIKGFRFESLS